MRVFPDTNVLVSAFATRGLCADLYRSLLAEHEITNSEFVLQELQRVLKLKFKIPNSLASELVIAVRERALVSTPSALPEIEIRDPDDLNVLAAALSCNAQVLITSDKDLLELPPLDGLSIATPRGFWEMLRS